MSITDWTYALSQINAIGGGLLNYNNAVNSGTSKAQAGADALALTTTNIFRNEWAKDMSERGNNLGWTVNCLTDYSNMASSQKGLFGLALADMPPLWGGGCHGGGFGMFGGGHLGIFGGGCHGGGLLAGPMHLPVRMPHFGGHGSVFIRNNFYC